MTFLFSQRIAALMLAASLLCAVLCGCRASSSEKTTAGGSLTSDSEPIETTAPDTATTPPVTTEPPMTTPTDTTEPGETTVGATELTETTVDTTEVTETTVDTTEVIETTVPTVTEPLPDWPLYADNAILAEAITKAVDTYGAFAVQVAVIAKGQVVTTAEYGWQVHKNIPLSSESKIRVASLSKTIHALVVFRLIEEGKLSLDTDISEYLGVTVRNPYYPNTKITIRHILSHSSSIKMLGYVGSVQELRAQLRRESSYRDVKPGDPAGYSYNNYAFGVLGTICEIVTGKNVSTLARQYFFDPLGIEAGWAPAALDRNTLTEIYDPNGLIGLSVDDLYGWVDSETVGANMKNYAGGLLISAEDYAKLLTLLMNDGCYNGVRYLSSSSVAQMMTAQFDRNEMTRQCLPVMCFKSLYGIRGLCYHTGSAYGVHNVYVFDAKSGLGVVVFTTGSPRILDDRGLYAIGGVLADAVFKNRATFEALATA